MPSTTLNYTAQVGNRVAAALGKEKDYRDESGQPRSATEAEYKEWLKEETQRMTIKNERRAQEQAISITPPEIT